MTYKSDSWAGLIVWFIFDVMSIAASKGTTEVLPVLIAAGISSVVTIPISRTYRGHKKLATILLLILAGIHAGLYIYDKRLPNPLTITPVICLFFAIQSAKRREKAARQAAEHERIVVESTILRGIQEEMRQERMKADQEVQYELNRRRKRVNDMTGIEFEQYCAGYLLTKKGFKEVRTTPVTGDYGADLIGIDADGVKWAVQCKRYNASVSNSAVQEVVAAMAHYGARRGLVMTNSYLTPGAKRLARDNKIDVIERMM